MAPHCGGLWALFQEAVVEVKIPQELSIKSRRLGFVYKGLQLICAIFLLVYITHVEIWKEVLSPRHNTLSVWSEAPLDAERMADASVLHCVAPEKFAYNYSGPSGITSYRPTHCRHLGSGEAVVKTGNDLFIPLHIIDTNELRAVAEDCGADDMQRCVDGSGHFHVDNGSCVCSRRLEYLVQNPEELQVHIMHGYVAPTHSGKVFGSAESQEWTSGSESEDSGRDYKSMVTVINKPDGSRCEVRGRSEFYSSHTLSEDIAGSLSEWLACAGWVMDSPPDAFGAAGSSLAPLRIMGFRLQISLHYSNNQRVYGNDIVVCRVGVKVLPIWTSAYRSQTQELDMQFGVRTVQQDRLSFGAMVEFQVAGYITHFSLNSLITGIVNTLFLLTVPRYVIQFVILYCMGSASVLYRHAKRTNFCIYDQVRSGLVRLMIPLMTFRGLHSGSWNGKARDLPGVSEGTMRAHLEDVFDKQIRTGALQECHITRMVKMIYEGGGESHKFKALTCGDLARFCMSNEVMGISELVDMIHISKKTTLLERLLDDTRTQEKRLDTPSRSSLTMPEHDLVTLLRRRCTSKESITQFGHEMSDAPRVVVKEEEEEGELGVGAPADRLATVERELQSLRRDLNQASTQLHASEERLRVSEARVEAAEARARTAEEQSHLAELLVKRVDEEATANAERLAAAESLVVRARDEATAVARGMEADCALRLAAVEELAASARDEAIAASFRTKAVQGSMCELQMKSRLALPE